MRIKIDEESVLFDLDEVKPEIVRLGKTYYWKNSTRLTKVGRKYFRKASPLIVQLSNGEYAEKNNVVRSSSGILLDVTDSNTLKLNGDYVDKSFVVIAEGKRHLITDSNIRRCIITGNYYLLSELSPLSEKYYHGAFVHKDYIDFCVADDSGDLILEDDSEQVLMEDEKIAFLHVAHGLFNKETMRVFRDFVVPNSGDMRNIRQIRCLAVQAETYKLISGCPIPNNQYKKVDKLTSAYNNSFNKESTASVKDILNTIYDEAGEDENTATRISMQYDSMAGGEIFYDPVVPPILSLTSLRTGGIKYTFGVEIETSAGNLSNTSCKTIQMSKVGDRSIGAYEYVSGILHGDLGMKALHKACDLISKRTFVDNRCGVHVHVGGYKAQRVQTPNFNTRFSVNSILLGCQLEAELYASQPTSRSPKMRHCYSIMGYKNINMDNWDSYLGAFIFGPEESKIKNKERLSSYSYKRYVRGCSGSKWHRSRYKWLNLNNLHTPRGFRTIEFRMFAGTTSFDKIKAYVLTSLAFVWFIENREHLVLRGDVTLNELFSEVFSSSPIIRDELISFYKNRTERFSKNK